MIRFISLAVDPIKQNLFVVGFGEKAADCADHHKRTRAAYFRTFAFPARGFVPELHDWLKQCGLPESVAVQTMRTLGRALDREFSQIAREKFGYA